MRQRIINDSFWTDPYIEGLDPSEKLVFLYLLTNPLCNIAGFYEITIKKIAYETGFDKDIIEKILNRFVRDKKIYRVKDFILIINFAKNQSKNPSILTGMQRILNSIPLAIWCELDRLYTGCIQSLTYFTLLNLTIPKGIDKEKYKKEKQNKTKTERNKKQKEIKIKLGEYGNVKLTQKEINKLQADFGEEVYKKYLKILDEGIQMNSKKYNYTDHNLAMRKWLDRAGIKIKTEEKRKDFNFLE